MSGRTIGARAGRRGDQPWHGHLRNACAASGRAAPAKPQQTPGSGEGKEAESWPVPIDSSKSTLTLGGAPRARMGAHSGCVCALRCRMNSMLGTARMTESSRSHASAAATSDMSTPLTAVAFTCTRPKPSSRSRSQNDASPRRTSSTRVEHRCAARRALPPNSRLAAASLSTHPGDAYRGSPSLSGLKSTPHSSHAYCCESTISRRGSTESSAPQSPSRRSGIRGESRRPRRWW